MPHPAIVTNTGQFQTQRLWPRRMTSPVGSVYIPMISGAKPVRFIALKNSAQSLGWAACERPMITRVRANQASMYGATASLLEGLVSKRISADPGLSKTIFWVSKIIARMARFSQWSMIKSALGRLPLLPESSGRPNLLDLLTRTRDLARGFAHVDLHETDPVGHFKRPIRQRDHIRT